MKYYKITTKLLNNLILNKMVSKHCLYLGNQFRITDISKKLTKTSLNLKTHLKHQFKTAPLHKGLEKDQVFEFMVLKKPCLRAHALIKQISRKTTLSHYNSNPSIKKM